MSVMFSIAWVEFKRMFNSPLAWSILAVLQFVLGMIFLVMVQEFIEVVQPETVGMENAPGVTDTVVSAIYLWAGIIMLAIMPIITMRSFAEERMNGTFTLLRTSPISVSAIVLGKYLALILFIVVMVALISLMPVSLQLGTSLDFGKILSSILGLFLLLASFAAAGLFISSLTNQPIIAAVSSFGLLLFLVVLYISGKSSSNGSELFVYVSHFGHFLSFLQGLFQSGDLIYYVLFIVGFLVLTIRKIDNESLQR